MRFLEISHMKFIKEAFPEETDFVDTSFVQLRGRGFSAMARAVGSQFARLCRAACLSRYDAVFCRCAGRYIYRRELSIHANALRLFMGWFIHLCIWVLTARGMSLSIIDYLDELTIDKRDLFLLDRCQCYFKRELTQNTWNVFLSTQPKHAEFVHLTENPRLRRNVKKFAPMSIGITGEKVRLIDEAIRQEGLAGEKEIDVFFSGLVDHSTVREAGMPLLEKLRERGYRIEHYTGRLPFPEFVRKMNRAWLVWSPEGSGWDCFRHYEALVAGSVPLINRTAHQRYQPLLPDVHCVEYSGEGDDLCAQVERALSDRSRLLQMAAAGRELTLKHHTHRGLGEYMVRHALGKKSPGLESVTK